MTILKQDFRLNGTDYSKMNSSVQGANYHRHTFNFNSWDNTKQSKDTQVGKNGSNVSHFNNFASA